jgi:hypothetical protein
MAKYKRYVKPGWEGDWRPEGKVLDLYVLERDDNTGRLVPYWTRTVSVKSEQAAKEYFYSEKVR